MKIDLRILAYEYIKKKILNNEYTSKQQITDELSIINTRVKEALLYLENENFVEIYPRKSM